MDDLKDPAPHDVKNQPVDTADSGEIEWAGTVSKKPPHADDGKSEAAEAEPDPLDEAERVGDHRYPA
jgi:hypothetical protein